MTSNSCNFIDLECQNKNCIKTTINSGTVIKNLTCKFGYISDGSNCIGKISFFPLQNIFELNKFTECGLTFVLPNVAANLRVVGGLKATENSWPSQVYIMKRYQDIYYLNNQLVEVKIMDFCGGTLIDSTTILTAAHCLFQNSFKYNYQGKEYNLMFKTNSKYHTIESMYTIYFGVNDISFINVSESSQNIVSRTVKRVIRVSTSFLRN